MDEILNSATGTPVHFAIREIAGMAVRFRTERRKVLRARFGTLTSAHAAADWLTERGQHDAADLLSQVASGHWVPLHTNKRWRWSAEVPESQRYPGSVGWLILAACSAVLDNSTLTGSILFD